MIFLHCNVDFLLCKEHILPFNFHALASYSLYTTAYAPSASRSLHPTTCVLQIHTPIICRVCAVRTHAVFLKCSFQLNQRPSESTSYLSDGLFIFIFLFIFPNAQSVHQLSPDKPGCLWRVHRRRGRGGRGWGLRRGGCCGG